MFNEKRMLKNKKLYESLKETLEKNANAIDFVTNEVTRLQDILAYDESNADARERLENFEYIGFCLSHLDGMYAKKYKSLGGKIVNGEVI